MAQFNIEKISLSSKDREKEEQKKLYKKKTLLVLIHHYLREYGFIQAADALMCEVNFNFKEYSVCDNIHLESIIQDYESYYFLKYQKLPQIMKRNLEDVQNRPTGSRMKNTRFHKSAKVADIIRSSSTDVGRKIDKNLCKAFHAVHDSLETNFNALGEINRQLLEPLGSFENYNSEWKSMADLILQDTQSMNASVHWDDIIGCNRAKELLKEAVIYPVKYQELFSSLCPWRSVLLYGPSGTGKTLLATAAASESSAMFFKLSISTIISKWRGESEKLIKVLFDLAKHYAPSIIFIDEIDALISHRGEDHEASRRMKTELFLQMDSLFATDKLVLVLSATNIPWQLDYAMLRRLEKRIHITHPDEECRVLLFKKLLPQCMNLSESCKIEMNLDYLKLAKITEHYSAADIETVCKEAKMNYVRQAVRALEFKTSGKSSVKTIVIEPLKTGEILQVINEIKPAASEQLSKYEDWKLKHGSE